MFLVDEMLQFFIDKIQDYLWWTLANLNLSCSVEMRKLAPHLPWFTYFNASDCSAYGLFMTKFTKWVGLWHSTRSCWYSSLCSVWILAGCRALQSSPQRGVLRQERSFGGNWSSGSSSLWRCDEAPDQSGWCHRWDRGRLFQDVRLWFRHSLILRWYICFPRCFSLLISHFAASFTNFSPGVISSCTIVNLVIV